MTESEIVGQRYLFKNHFVRNIQDRRKKTPDLTFDEWLELLGVSILEFRSYGMDLDDLIWCWRKATGEA